jgi:hypothetical protein
MIIGTRLAAAWHRAAASLISAGLVSTDVRAADYPERTGDR